MALTEVARLRLEDKEFDQLFATNQAAWATMAHAARATMAGRVANGQPTIDDVKKILYPMVEVDAGLRAHMVTHKANGKRWIDDFTDYILHRVYAPTLLLPPTQA